MQLPLKWQRQPIAGAPSEFYSKASTTKSAYLAQEAVTIIELNQISPFHQQKDFRPSANRNVAMFKNDDLWLFASSWLDAPTASSTYKKYSELKQQPLGLLLFNDTWVRSDFLFAEHSGAFCRRSYFRHCEAKLLFMEFFVKSNICGVKSHCAQTKSKTAHE